jgi:uncharacterized membrane protein
MLFVFGAITSIAAMFTGEGAEDVAETISGVTDNYLEIHEEAAETFSIPSYVLGGISLIGLWASIKQKSGSSIISIVSCVLACVVLFYARQTGTTGGEIRHTEIRSEGNVHMPPDRHIE